MDHFGIGQAMQAVAQVYFQSARQTGRTTSLLDSLKNGDRIACADVMHAQHLQQKCRERGLSVEVIVLSTKSPGDLLSRKTPKGRTIFDHSLVERYYMEALEACSKDIDALQQQASGQQEVFKEVFRLL